MRRIIPAGSERSLSPQLKRCCVASYAGSPTNGFGSITSHRSRCDRRTLPACKSVASRTSVGALRGNSFRKCRPSRTISVSGHCSASASVSSHQYSVKIDKERKACGGDGERHRRRSSAAITRSCSGSGSVRSAVPGSQRSKSMAPRASSASISRTVGSPSQKRSPRISCSPSMCGIPSFRTADAPAASVTGATHAQLTFSKGSPSVRHHRRSKVATNPGNRSSHAARSGVLRHSAASCLGILVAMPSLCSSVAGSAWS